jgi:flagellar biosynthetic protein FlhB
MADRSGKTEQATPRRLEKARREGQFPSAKEFVAALQFLTFVALASAMGARWLAGFRESARSMLRLAFSAELTPRTLTSIARQIFWSDLLPLLAGGLAVAVATVGVRLVTTQFGFSFKKLAPDPARFNPVSRLRELPRQNLSSVVQAVIMLPLFLWAAWAIVSEKLEAFLALPLTTVESGCGLVAASLMELCWKSTAVFLAFGAFDLFRQMRRHKSDLKMSRQEIQDEYKELEGNPQIKSRIRRLQRDRARRNMMKEIPTATAVVVNPTHFAVAIRYQMESMAAPLVVAKGKNYLAARIRQRAMDHQIPIVENPPLARALYKSVDVGQEIPPHLYRAVAEILAYIFKMMNGRMPN